MCPWESNSKSLWVTYFCTSIFLFDREHFHVFFSFPHQLKVKNTVVPFFLYKYQLFLKPLCHLRWRRSRHQSPSMGRDLTTAPEWNCLCRDASSVNQTGISKLPVVTDPPINRRTPPQAKGMMTTADWIAYVSPMRNQSSLSDSVFLTEDHEINFLVQ